ncbi:MAG: cytochrome c biogenesis protein CcsA [Rhodospirillales bacterium]|jgi:ABC-type uncharacterized transport system permease subunit|nr:cytochrome c biogenesis protein CcsA [Rhodospirillales bacterium]
MSGNIVYSLIAFASILPAAAFTLAGKTERTPAFWGTLALAVAGPVIWLVIHSNGAWRSDFSSAIWVTVVFTLVCYSAVAVLSRQGWQLASIVMPYMALLALIAAIWENAGTGSAAGAGGSNTISNPWVIFHVMISVITYAVVTLAACAALAGFLRERALKNKQSTPLTQRLPSMSDCDELQLKLLGFGELVLGLGLITGMAATFTKDGSLLHIDHKSILAMLAFAVIGILLIVHRKSGVRGRQAARMILAGYLLLTLAYPGVKFVTDVLIGA